jgi:hypothetical protein
MLGGQRGSLRKRLYRDDRPTIDTVDHLSVVVLGRLPWEIYGEEWWEAIEQEERRCKGTVKKPCTNPRCECRCSTATTS